MAIISPVLGLSEGELKESNLYPYLLSKTEADSGNAVILRHFKMNSSIMIPNNTESSTKFLSWSDLISKLHATCALLSLQSRFRIERNPTAVIRTTFEPNTICPWQMIFKNFILCCGYFHKYHQKGISFSWYWLNPSLWCWPKVLSWLTFLTG